MNLKIKGLPIAVQIGLLIVGCLLAAQLVALAVLSLTPPPPPQIYRLSEVAAALNGGSLEPRLGRPLVRELIDAPPRLREDGRRQGMMMGRGRLLLASALGVSPERVRLLRPRGTWPARFLEGRGLAAPPDRPPPEPGRGFGRADRDFLNGPGPAQGPPWHGPGGGPRASDIDIIGGFVAAVRQDDGRWLVVHPKPSPFPNDWQRKAGLWMLACLLMAGAAGWWFARRITAPIDRFADAAGRLGRDPNGPPMDLDGPAEIGRAASAFNEMQVRLKRYVGDRTAMVGAISHDLRTPLSRIRFKLEARSPDPASILGDVEQMEAMIASVLAFIRDSAAVARREKLDLLSVVEVVVDDAALVGGAVQLTEGQPLIVEGDAMALRRLLANLVDNALKYGGAARVRVTAQDRIAAVEIEDDGPGMRPEDLARAFEPFYRADASRNLDEGGVGLGLAVARSLARAHGGDVELIPRNGSQSGMTARVTLPLA
jgi:two-component system OmpR family sensor kinase